MTANWFATCVPPRRTAARREPVALGDAAAVVAKAFH